jgi:hypothetical protein
MSIRAVNDHIVVVVPDDHVVIAPWCSLCEFVLSSSEDEAAVLEFGCCSLCAMHWAHPDRERWLSGWRPSREQLDKFIVERKQLVHERFFAFD